MSPFKILCAFFMAAVVVDQATSLPALRVLQGDARALPINSVTLDMNNSNSWKDDKGVKHIQRQYFLTNKSERDICNVVLAIPVGTTGDVHSSYGTDLKKNARAAGEYTATFPSYMKKLGPGEVLTLGFIFNGTDTLGTVTVQNVTAC